MANYSHILVLKKPTHVPIIAINYSTLRCRKVKVIEIPFPPRKTIHFIALTLDALLDPQDLCIVLWAHIFPFGDFFRKCKECVPYILLPTIISMSEFLSMQHKNILLFSSHNIFKSDV